jgi:alanyl aminopeptidase
VSPELKPRVAAYAARLYRGRLQKLGWKPAAKEPASARRLRGALVGLLTLQLPDPATLKQASQLGHAYAGTDGKFHPEAVSPDLAPVVLAAAVRADPKLVPTLVDRLSTLDDAELRQRVLGAVSSTEDPATSQTVLALWKDPRLRQSEIPWPLFGQMERPQTREQAWQALQSDFDAMMPKLEPMFRGYSPQIASVFCDEEHAKQVDAFFRPQLKKYPEMRLSLEHALEDIQECVSLRKAQQASLDAFFKKH